MEDNNVSVKSQGIRALVCIQLAAESLYNLYESAPAPDARRECLQSAGELHKMAEKLKARFKVT